MKSVLIAGVFLAVVPPANPLSPTNLQQFQSDGTTALAQGGTVTGASVVLKAVVNTTDATARVRFEVKPVATPFSNTATIESALLPNGTLASVTVSGLSPGSYKWQAWVFCTCGTNGAAVQHGATDPDFVVAAGNLPPSAPALLAQYLSDNITPLPIGGTVTDGVVMVKALIGDFNMDAVKLQVEMRPTGTPFSGAMTHESIYVTSGTIATVQVPGLAGAYRWQVRAVDSNGAGGAWVANGGSPDFTAAGSSGIDTRDAPNGDCSGAAGGGIDFPLLVAGFMAIGLLAAAVMPRENERKDR